MASPADLRTSAVIAHACMLGHGTGSPGAWKNGARGIRDRAIADPPIRRRVSR
jgi:hypothetical protein